MKGIRILVLGDAILDAYLWGRVRRISPEAPVPVVEIESPPGGGAGPQEEFRAGGAGNVARGIAALDGTAVLVAARGRDESGERLSKILAQDGIEDRLVPLDDRGTTSKTRVVAGQQQIVRIDRERTDPIPPEARARIRSEALAAAEGAQALVISDYDKGLLSQDLLDAVGDSFRSRNLPIVVDPNVEHFFHYGRVTVVTPNQNELERACGAKIRDEESLDRTAREALARFAKGTQLLVTRGEAGMTLFGGAAAAGGAAGDGTRTHIPTVARQVYDVTGAGDTVVATLALALAAGASLMEGAKLANLAAGIVVAKRGAATVTRDEIRARMGDVR